MTEPPRRPKEIFFFIALSLHLQNFFIMPLHVSESVYVSISLSQRPPPRKQESWHLHLCILLILNVNSFSHHAMNGCMIRRVRENHSLFISATKVLSTYEVQSTGLAVGYSNGQNTQSLCPHGSYILLGVIQQSDACVIWCPVLCGENSNIEKR